MKLMKLVAGFTALMTATGTLQADEAKPAAKEMSKMSANPGEVAPAFTLKDLSGEEHSLSDFKGETVVLEWVNYGCPFVKKHYGSGNMQKLQETYKGQDVVWLSVVSGKTTEGFSQSSADEAGSKATAILLDPTGETGKDYDAKTTPHIFVINTKGEVVYNGAIDSNSSANPADIEGAEKYVVEALDAVLAGEEVKTAKTKPYGCSVKY